MTRVNCMYLLYAYIHAHNPECELMMAQVYVEAGEGNIDTLSSLASKGLYYVVSAPNVE